MPRLHRAAVVLLVASCATTPPVTLGNGGNGGGGGGGATTTPTNTGGSPFGSGGAPPFVDAGACAPFTETFTPACVACLAASCCGVAMACFNVPDCFGYTSCQQNCPPVATTDGGVDGGVDAGVDGGVDGGGSVDGGGVDGGSVDGGGVDGGGVDGGGGGGGGNVCLDACIQNFPMAQPAFGMMESCLQTSCATSCP